MTIPERLVHSTTRCRPLRVVLVSAFEAPWGTEVAFAETLELLGHEVIRLPEARTRWPQVERAARRADLLWWTRSHGLHPASAGRRTLTRLAASGVVTVSVHLDLYVGLRRQVDIGRDAFWSTMHVATADGDPTSAAVFKRAGIDHWWFPPAIHEAWARRGNPDRWPGVDVGFVGSARDGYHHEWPWRRRLIDGLRARFGDRFVHAGGDGRPVRLSDLDDFCASVPVIVGDSLSPPGHTNYWSDRFPEICGRRGFLIGPAVPGIEAHYRPGEHFVPYPLEDLDAVIELVGEWLGRPDDRRAVADAAYQHTLQHHTYRHRVEELLGRLAAVHPQLAAGTVRRRALRLRTPDRAGHATFTVRLGLEDPQARMQGVDTVTLHETWKANDYRLTRDQVRGRVVVDVGANIGGFSVLAAVYGAGRVVAVEAEPRNRAVLCENIHANRLEGRVTVEPRPVGVGTLEMVTTGGGAWARPSDDGVPAVSLAQLVAEHDVPHGSMLKIDIEGSELDLLMGADPETLRRFDQIVFEWHWGCGAGPGGEEGLRRWDALRDHLSGTHHVESTWRPPADIGLVFCTLR